MIDKNAPQEGTPTTLILPTRFNVAYADIALVPIEDERTPQECQEIAHPHMLLNFATSEHVFQVAVPKEAVQGFIEQAVHAHDHLFGIAECQAREPRIITATGTQVKT